MTHIGQFSERLKLKACDRRTRWIDRLSSRHIGPQKARDLMTVLLKPIRGGRPIVIDKPIVLIGRHPECDVIIEVSPKISRKHCFVAIADNRMYVRDLESMNGVWVNGERVMDSTLLDIGDELMIGDVAFEVTKNSPKTVSKAPPPKRDDITPPPETKKRKRVEDERTLADADGKDGLVFGSDFEMPTHKPRKRSQESDEDFMIPLADLDE